MVQPPPIATNTADHKTIRLTAKTADLGLPRKGMLQPRPSTIIASDAQRKKPV
jgi:hypothetical protein